MSLSKLLLQQQIDLNLLQKELGKHNVNILDFNDYTLSASQINLLTEFCKSILIADENSITKKMAVINIINTLKNLKALGNSGNKKPENSEVIETKNEFELIDKYFAQIESTKHQANKKPQNKGTNSKASNAIEKLGRIKFFDYKVNNFGMLSDLDTNLEFRIYHDNIVEGILNENDIVKYNQSQSARPRLSNISNEIPIFIFNKDNNKNSYAFPIINNKLCVEKESALINTRTKGFVIANVKQQANGWGITATKEVDVQHLHTKENINEIFKKLILDFANNTTTINWLLENHIDAFEAEILKSSIEQCMNQIEPQTIPEISEFVSKIATLTQFSILIAGKVNSLNKISFVLWANGLLDELPNADNAEAVDIWNNQIISILTWKSLQKTILKLQEEKYNQQLIESAFHYLLEDGWQINDEDELALVVDFLKKYKHENLSIDESKFDCDDLEYYFVLQTEEILKSLSDNIIVPYIQGLTNAEKQIAFIEAQEPENIFKYYALVPELDYARHNYFSQYFADTFKLLDFICFDLESNRDSIFEYAWCNKQIITSNADFIKAEEGIDKLVKNLSSNNIIVGHNIKQFDLPILKNNFKLDILPINVYDTLEMEMLLNPTRQSYALNTNHNAIDDVANTLTVFKCQILQLIVNRDLFITIIKFLPPAIIQFIESINLQGEKNSAHLYLETNQYNLLFRTTASFKKLPDAFLQAIQNQLSISNDSLIVLPRYLFELFANNFDVVFFEDDSIYNYILDSDKVNNYSFENNLYKAILNNYIASHLATSSIPYYWQLPLAIKLQLPQDAIYFICNNLLKENIISGNLLKVVTSDGIINFCNDKNNHPLPETIVTIAHDLIMFDEKILLASDLDFSFVSNKLKDSPVLLNLSGGRNFNFINKPIAHSLGVIHFPNEMDNLWLEKTERAKFKIWCTINFQKIVETQNFTNKIIINWGDSSINQSETYIVYPDFKKSHYSAEVNRVNPESTNRILYWSAQFKIFDSICKNSTSNILILNDNLEFEKLHAYCRTIGYFIPDQNAQLARRVELMHSHPNAKKIIIITVAELQTCISLNSDEPINFIWDSFLLKEKEVMIGANKYEKYFQNKISKNSNSNRLLLDNIDLLLLHTPITNFYKTLISENHANSKLYLCDVRFSDYYYDITVNFNAKKVYYPLWATEKESKQSFDLASKYFSNKGANADCNFKLSDAKETLQKIFLKNKDEGFYEWRDYQIQYLDNILEAKNDLLISLPTGAGKSILFQGPALYRSAYTCKLSIVVTPLKALMHDQVTGLHEKGFLSNVDYLSGDKSQSEIVNILRKVVGGELTLLYITPERFRSRRFENAFLTRMLADDGLEFAIYDEAHCISQWGQEFRPDYLYSAKKISEFSKMSSIRKLLFSATISNQVFNEIATIIPNVIKLENTEQTYNPVRDHIKIQFKNNVRKADRLEEIANYLKDLKSELSRAIVFVRSRDNVDDFAIDFNNVIQEVLGAESVLLNKIGGYHAGMDAEDRKSIYDKYASGDILVLFATKAFGMGMDIANIHYLVHHRPPSTFEDFLQEIGRAGRNEESRILAGFNQKENQINALCLTEENDFEKLRQQLIESRISWENIKETKIIVENYYKSFLTFMPNEENYIALPFNLFSQKSNADDNNLDVIFRLGLHWLEKLNRIKLRYFTITHLNFNVASIEKVKFTKPLGVSEDGVKLLDRICKLGSLGNTDAEYTQIQITTLLQESKLSMEKMFELLIQFDKSNLIITNQPIKIELTKTRTTEIKSETKKANDKYLVLKLTFEFAKKLLKKVPDNDVWQFSGEEIQAQLDELIKENLEFKKNLSWSNKESPEDKAKELKKYIVEFITKRSKHVFSLINILPKAKHESKLVIENGIDKNNLVVQSIFNGYNKKEEWKMLLDDMENDCIKIIEYVNERLSVDVNVEFNWLNIINELELKPSFTYFSDLLFITRILGYLKYGDLLPTGIETAVFSEDLIDEKAVASNDQIIFNEFEETQKVRELKLVALQVLSKLSNEKQDGFIRSFFSCDSSNSLLILLQEYLDDDDDLLIKWRGDAIIKRENELNEEQRLVYNEDINTHINVIAGPGSGKTHTLALRVAKLIHHAEIKADTFLVLAYNRAVVSELKIRLKKLFTELGYGTVVKNIKIFTFHGLAKKYCNAETKGKPFNEWEQILLKKLTDEGGSMITQIGNLKHILVDEFQDINKVRIDLLTRFHELTEAKLFIIGDRNQSIYGYDRLNEEGGTISPIKYYQDFYNIFTPKKFELYKNHRSFIDILDMAGNMLPEDDKKKLMSVSPFHKVPQNFIEKYTEVFDIREVQLNWWDKINGLLTEKINEKPYKQIAILFRGNNEVYKGFQRVQSLQLDNVRIRIQGSLPYEFTRIRECNELLVWLKIDNEKTLHFDLGNKTKIKIEQLLNAYPTWNEYYLFSVYAIILEFIEEGNESATYLELVEFIIEITQKDDGQIQKIYDKHISNEKDNKVEIVLTTMHKVKGLEFDAVIVAPSYSELPYGFSKPEFMHHILNEYIEEERRIAVDA
jgi:RecQ family ATP-dependent DNA helicase